MRRRRVLSGLVARLGGEPPRAGEDPRAAVERAAAALLARAESAETAREVLVRAVEVFSEGVVVVDAGGEVVVRNAAAEEFHGARHAEALAEDALAGLLAVARRGDRGEKEVSLFGPPRRVLRIRAEPLATADGRVGAVAFVTDVSEARRAAEVRRDFVANVSHELKTPIGGLALLAETIAAGHDPEVVRRLADQLVREADRLARIVDDLLDLSFAEAQEAPHREAVELTALVGEALDEVRATSESAGVPLAVVGSLPAAEVTCDRRQLLTALVNLLDNAVKYSERGQQVEVSIRLDDDLVAFVVRDRGIGIPARDLERIFERFYRVDRARSRQTGGTGLGLSIVRHVALSHGGEVAVESVEGEGSTFTLVIPREAGAGPGSGGTP